jgi:hypothetical protein
LLDKRIEYVYITIRKQNWEENKMKKDKMEILIGMIEKGGESYRKARDLMGISVKYEIFDNNERREIK